MVAAKMADRLAPGRETCPVSARLFVYGTLAPGRPNERILAGVAGKWETATVCGELVDRGWGAAHGYPALVLQPDGVEVSGYVFTSDALAEHWAALDDFEGPGYERVLTEARIEGGAIVDAWVYVDRTVAPNESP